MAYLTETVRVPAQIAVKAVKSTCCKKRQVPVCGHVPAAEKSDGGKKSSCNRRTMGKNAGEKNEPCSNQDCNNTAGCINCPMCYIATAPAAYHTGILYPSLVADYATMSAGRPTDYACLSWKPPDAGSFTYGPFII
jgi:hypothetical protein